MHKGEALVAVPKPFVKWAGGKGRIVEGLIDRLPSDIANCGIKKYFEPFVGGGALLFALVDRYKIKECIVNDSNKALINSYEAIKEDPENLVETLSRMEVRFSRLGKRDQRSYYYRKRSRFNALCKDRRNEDRTESAALLIFLNKTCWNGLFRLNRSGEFNVPIGQYTSPTICDSERILAASKALRNVEFHCEDFRVFFSRFESLGSESLMYIDPPYVVPHANNGFLDYNEKVFSWQDQMDLASEVTRFASGGARVMVSNARHSSIRELYHTPTFLEHALPRFSGIAADSSRRRRVSKLVLTSYAVESSIHQDSMRG